MASSDIDLRSLEELQRRLAALAMRIENIGVANKAVAASLYGFVIRNFQTEGGLTPNGWPDLATATIREKKRIGKEKKLVRTGRLKGSFVPFSSNQTAGVKSDLEYADFHDSGTEKIPQRKITPTPEQAGEIATVVYQRYIDRQLLDQRFNFTGTRATSRFNVTGLEEAGSTQTSSGGGGGGGGGGGKKKKRKKAATKTVRRRK